MKYHDHFLNSLLIVPFICILGQPWLAVFVMVIGKLLDYAEERNFKQRHEEWLRNPHRHSQKTSQEYRERQIKQCKYSDLIDQFMKNNKATVLYNYPNKYHGYNNDSCKAIPDYDMTYSNMKVVQGKVVFTHGYFDDYMSVPAICYYNTDEFYQRLVYDYNHFRNIKLFTFGDRINMKIGQWMYTIDNGKSYVVGLK